MGFHWKKEWTTPAAVGVVSFAAGVGVGILGYRKRLDIVIRRDQEVLDALSEAAEEAVKHFPVPNFKDLVIDQKVSFPETDESTNDVDRSKVEELAGAFGLSLDQAERVIAEGIEERSFKLPPSSDPVKEKEFINRHNVFADHPVDDEDWSEERGPNNPYVLKLNEYHDRERGYPQQTLTWWAGDKILTDDNMVPIYNHEKIVGQLPFGRGSGDPDVVYIRNEERQAEFEVVRNPGSFQREIMGLQAEEQADADDIKHSSQIRRFRDTD